MLFIINTSFFTLSDNIPLDLTEGINLDLGKVKGPLKVGP